MSSNISAAVFALQWSKASNLKRSGSSASSVAVIQRVSTLLTKKRMNGMWDLTRKKIQKITEKDVLKCFRRGSANDDNDKSDESDDSDDTDDDDDDDRTPSGLNTPVEVPLSIDEQAEIEAMSSGGVSPKHQLSVTSSVNMTSFQKIETCYELDALEVLSTEVSSCFEQWSKDKSEESITMSGFYNDVMERYVAAVDAGKVTLTVNSLDELMETPLHEQGNADMHSKQALEKRFELRRSERIVKLLESIWEKLPKVDDHKNGISAQGAKELRFGKVVQKEGFVNFNVFRAFSAMLFHRLVPGGTREDFLPLLGMDWRQKAFHVVMDPKTRRLTKIPAKDMPDLRYFEMLMDEKSFKTAMFEIMDVWTISVKVDEYISFGVQVLVKQARKLRRMDPLHFYDVHRVFGNMGGPANAARTKGANPARLYEEPIEAGTKGGIEARKAKEEAERNQLQKKPMVTGGGHGGTGMASSVLGGAFPPAPLPTHTAAVTKPKWNPDRVAALSQPKSIADGTPTEQQDKEFPANASTRTQEGGNESPPPASSSLAPSSEVKGPSVKKTPLAPISVAQKKIMAKPEYRAKPVQMNLGEMPAPLGHSKFPMKKR